MIEKRLFEIINTQVEAVTTAGDANDPLFGLDVHRNLWCKIDIDNKPNAIRLDRPTGFKSPGLESVTIIEGECQLPVLVYVRIPNAKSDDGTEREAAFVKADAIANALVLYLWNGGLETQQLIFANADIDFGRIDAVYDSNSYAVVSMTLTLSEVMC